MILLPELFNQAVMAAKAGQRVHARRLFSQVVEQDPSHAQAWAWLSELADGLDEQVTALENTRAFCKDEGEYLALLEGVRANNHTVPRAPLSIEQHQKVERLHREAAHLASAGKRGEAVRAAESIIAIDPYDAQAWLLLSEVRPDPDGKVHALEEALAINPANSAAAHRLESLRQTQQDPLRRGRTLEARGAFDEAISIYRLLIVHSPSPAERLEAARRIDSLHLRQEAHQIQPVHPTLNLLRLTFGPVLLFGLMLFLQSGLKPLHMPPAGLLGLVGVVVGSLLVAVTGMRPAHPRWVALVGEPGTGDEPEMRHGLQLLGWALMLAPFTLFFIEASYRLGILQASMIGGVR